MKCTHETYIGSLWKQRRMQLAVCYVTLMEDLSQKPPNTRSRVPNGQHLTELEPNKEDVIISLVQVENGRVPSKCSCNACRTVRYIVETFIITKYNRKMFEINRAIANAVERRTKLKIRVQHETLYSRETTNSKPTCITKKQIIYSFIFSLNRRHRLYVLHVSLDL